jgi:hypothetical protein
MQDTIKQRFRVRIVINGNHLKFYLMNIKAQFNIQIGATLKSVFGNVTTGRIITGICGTRMINFNKVCKFNTNRDF